MEDGMNEEEALIAVQPPLLTLVDAETTPSEDETIKINHLKLNDCYVRLQRMPQIELMISNRVEKPQ